MEKKLGNCQPFQEMSEMTTFQYPVLSLPFRVIIPRSRNFFSCFSTPRFDNPICSAMFSADKDGLEAKSNKTFLSFAPNFTPNFTPNSLPNFASNSSSVFGKGLPWCSFNVLYISSSIKSINGPDCPAEYQRKFNFSLYFRDLRAPLYPHCK